MELRIKELLQGVNFESGQQFSVIIITNGSSDAQISITEDDVPAILGLMSPSYIDKSPATTCGPPPPEMPAASIPVPPRADPMFSAVMGEDAPAPTYLPQDDDYARSPSELLASAQEETTDPGEISSRVRVAQI